ncbi:hypothetical protein Moror_17489 [Moniliophthora roreri MCA 2997]|uniref:DUF302 domain-containing protein n=2 Tax=Moniliophthora roreri TaxID=221103 RepID=V2XV59_MONRO|nr:hypothetical protein Moror_17489 [Moniliophthora roreri MCA 2997]KAI3612461.1 hypothetical protein WG66_009853 [Moniliophthora roreri]
MPGTKTITPFTAQLVTFETDLSPEQVVSRLDEQLRRPDSARLIPLLSSATSKDALEKGLKEISQGNDFMYFLSMQHDTWLKLYDDNAPFIAVYTIGNPTIAQGIMKHDRRAAYNIPPRLLVLEKEDRTGTQLIYHLPSSVMVLDDSNTELTANVKALDKKLDQLMVEVTK